MAIWFKNYTVEDLNKRATNTHSEHIGIRFTAVGEDYVEATMPVDHKTKQPAGLLHGGASVSFAETLASTGANMTIDPSQEMCVGLEINANHIRGCREGLVVGRAAPLHVGKSTQVWEIKIRQEEKLVCVSRITLSVLLLRHSIVQK